MLEHRRGLQAVEGQAPPHAAAAMPVPEFLQVGDGAAARRIAYLRRAAANRDTRPGLVWFGGFRSTMRGEKATDLDRVAAASGQAFLHFDYSGHGESGGRFEAGTIGRWLEESVVAVQTLSEGPQIIVGSSMGSWLALLAARALHAAGEASRLKGLVLIAPAVDMTERLIFARLPRRARAELARNGMTLRASPYEVEPHPVTRALIEDGRAHLLFGGAIRSHCPVHILQGMQDEAVPWRHALELVEHMPGDPVTLTLIRDGDHRLSRPQDLARIRVAVEGMEDDRLDNPAPLL